MRLEQTVGTQLGQGRADCHDTHANALGQLGLGRQAVAVAQHSKNNRLTNPSSDLGNGRRRVDRLEDRVAYVDGLVFPHGCIDLSHCVTIRNVGATCELLARELEQNLAGLDALPCLHMHRLDRTGVERGDLVFHLHRLNNRHDLARLDVIALGDLEL